MVDMAQDWTVPVPGPVAGRRAHRHRARLRRGVRPCGGHPGLRRHRYRQERAVRTPCAEPPRRWPSAGLPPSPAGWLITTARNRAVDRLRREAARDGKHAQAALLHAREEKEEEEGRCAMTGYGSCSPAATRRWPARRAGRAHAPAARRAHHGARWRHAFLVPEPTMAQRLVRAKAKIRNAGILTASRRRPMCPPGSGRARRRLPDLRRGLHGEFGSGAGAGRPVRRGDPARAAAGRAHAGRAGGARAARADADRVAAGRPNGAWTARWCCSPTRTGHAGTACSSPRGRPSSGSACGVTSPARTRSRRPSARCTVTRRPDPTPTGTRSCGCTTSCSRSRQARWSHSTAPSRWPRSTARRWPSIWSTAWPLPTWAGTTCSTPSAPTCSGGWAGPPRPGPPTETAIAQAGNAAERGYLTQAKERLPRDQPPVS